ncbi:MAG: YihY/virulence factor BrkB family protein [Opitutaceae bacterium]|jgi:membrane protein|nr:YihY/virulence factor BrkB family protein [Opitutaceae bacterium]
MPRPLPVLWKRTVHLFKKEIWQPEYIADRTPRGLAYAVLRVISITVTGVIATRATSRAAALSFTTLLSLGPLVALAVLVAGFTIRNNPDFVADKLNRLITFIAPQMDQYEELRRREEDAARRLPAFEAPRAAAPEAADAPGAGAQALRPEVLDLINTFVASARSGTVGGVSAVSFIVIVLLLFSGIEGVFNDIWGVRRGRSWLTRIVFYWAIVSLGALLFFIAVGTVSAATFAAFFDEKIPYGAHVLNAARRLLPVLSVVLVLGVLTLFYRCVPNTRVHWRAAFAGAVVMAVLLVGNNLLAFLYFSRVNMTRSLYGPLGVAPVLMFGLYVFWMIVLIGGQVSYAVQNVHFRNSQTAWGTLAGSTRERLALAVFLTIARRFQACRPPASLAQLGATVTVPSQILNECLNRLTDLGLVSRVPPGPRDASGEYLYQPARPLNRVTLAAFKHRFETHGEDPAGDTIDGLDPLIRRYHDALRDLDRHTLLQTPLDQLFAEENNGRKVAGGE